MTDFDPFEADGRRARRKRAAPSEDDSPSARLDRSRDSTGPLVDGPSSPPNPADPLSSAPNPPDAPRARKAGRNLPAAIGVGLGLGALVLACLFIWRPAALVLLAAAVVLGTWELVRALGAGPQSPPLIPLAAGAVLMIGLAWFGDVDALTVGLLLTVLATSVWRLADGPPGYRRSVTVAAMVAVYLPFLASFLVLLLRPEDGALRVVAVVAAVVLSDTGGYAAGVFFGKHPMAPTVSPKKSWEGFSGSVLACSVGGALMLWLMFDAPWWAGAVFGVVIALGATLGDLAESLLKRDMGVKDMGTLLPGHGGVMDRMDSLLVAAPLGYILLSALASPAA